MDVTEIILVFDDGTRRTVPVPADAPPPSTWERITPTWTKELPDGQVVHGYDAQPAAGSIRVSFDWTMNRTLSYGEEFEPFALVEERVAPDGALLRAVGGRGISYAVLRKQPRSKMKLRWKTGVGVKMDEKGLDEARWTPEVGVTYSVEGRVDAEGTAHLQIRDASTITAVSLVAPRPLNGALGPWDFPLWLQLGGPAGKSHGSIFSNVVVEILMG